LKIEELRHRRRSEEEWAPFMETLRSRMRRERRARLLKRIAAGTLAASAAAALWLAQHGARVAPPGLLRADVPAAQSPLFRPQGGADVASGAVVVVRVEDRT
jgi:hypothetical protein